jgi:D-alanyl-D-alanine carboxypeptidase/D-alanyl-D-alanine-endopeptidase (penicillin-binding protein 4)
MKVNGLIIALCIIWIPRSEANSPKLESLLDHSGLKKSDVGALVTDGQNHTLFDLNGERHFIPASISKLLTTAAVMNAFQPFTKFHTQIYTDGDQEGETLKGNIYIKGMGDPAFVSEKMWMLVNDFTRTGIKKITGDIYADDTFFDSERFDPGREEDRNDRAYDAPIGALSFDWNSTSIFIRPGKKAGDPANIFIDPVNKYVELKGEVKTSSHGTDLSAEKVSEESKDIFTVRGKIPTDSEEKHIYKNISSPPLYAAYNFKEFLSQRNITVDGGIKLGAVPKSAALRSDLEGEPLSRLITDMNKFSNNYVAEMLAKDLGAFKTGKVGRMADGLNEIRNFLQEELGWNPSSYVLANVSGFTRKNSLTPKQFVQVLSWVQKQFKLYPEFLQSLPVAGIDGTLQKRMKNGGAEGWVRAKTGLLNGVVALSGYAGSHDGTVKVFTFIYNGHGDEGHVRETFDAMASSLVR